MIQLGGGNSNISYVHPENGGRQIPILIDEHIFFKWGVLNHQLEEMMVEKSPTERIDGYSQPLPLKATGLS